MLLVDLVRAIGTPDFDEYSHGLVASESAFALFSNPRLLILLAISLDHRAAVDRAAAFLSRAWAAR